MEEEVEEEMEEEEEEEVEVEVEEVEELQGLWGVEQALVDTLIRLYHRNILTILSNNHIL